jgi:UDP-N-acetylglucosamine/UDP-N-acetylgalactosamine diphosphorylase
MSDRLATVRSTLESHGQEHVLRFADSLQDARREALLDQVEAIDFVALDELIEEYVRQDVVFELPADLEPAAYHPLAAGHGHRGAGARSERQAGEQLIADGRVAAFTVAGGQGTRLGWNGPKGTYPATVVTGKPLFRCFAEQIIAAEKKYGVTIPWYIMTSPLNDAATRAFFLDNNCFGLMRKNIFMFPQGVMPSLEAGTGRLLLSEPHALAMHPDGHGGSIKALRESGAVEDMRSRGIEHISYFQVDNPLVSVIDPEFLGLHVAGSDSSGEMSSKMVAKTTPGERVGVLCRSGDRTMVVEYSDLPDELARQRDEHGHLRFCAGSIAIHAISVAFVEQLTADARHFALPYHRALKKVPFIDIESGERVEPGEPNAVKLETFVFDALPLAEASLVYETDRTEEFAPIKNGSGADSPPTSHQLQCDRAGRWLEAHGITVPRDDEGRVTARIEISPLTALEPADLVAVDLPEEIHVGEEIVL